MRLIDRLLAAVFGCVLAASITVPAGFTPAFAQAGNRLQPRLPLPIHSTSTPQPPTSSRPARHRRRLRGSHHQGPAVHRKNQLTQKGIVPDATYSKIQALIIAKRSAK